MTWNEQYIWQEWNELYIDLDYMRTNRHGFDDILAIKREILKLESNNRKFLISQLRHQPKEVRDECKHLFINHQPHSQSKEAK